MTGSYPITLPNISAILQGDNGALANAVINAPDGAMLLYQNKQRQDAQIQGYLQTLKDSNIAQRVLANRQMDIEQQHNDQTFDAALAGTLAPNATAGVDSSQIAPIRKRLITPEGNNPETSSLAAAALGKRVATVGAAQKDIGQGAEALGNAGYIIGDGVDPSSGVLPKAKYDPLHSLGLAKAAIGGAGISTLSDSTGANIGQTTKGNLDLANRILGGLPGGAGASVGGGMPTGQAAVEADRAATPQELQAITGSVQDKAVQDALRAGNVTKKIEKNAQGQPVNNFYVTYKRSDGGNATMVITTPAGQPNKILGIHNSNH